MSSTKQWRYMLLAVLAIVALAVFAACNDDEDDGEDTGDGGDGTTTGERIDGGTMTVQHIEPDSLDPHFSSFAQDISIQRMLWRGLYSLDMDNQPVPAMASGDIEQSEDGLTVTVPLKKGLLWSDGDDLLAEDFVLGIQRTCNPINAGEYSFVLIDLAPVAGCAEYYGALAGPDGEADTADDLAPDDPQLETLRAAVGVRAVDDLTLEFTLTAPSQTFQTILTMWLTFPVPAHLLPDPGQAWPVGADAAGALAFNGPYILTEYVTGTSATLAPNPNWSEEYSPVGAAPTLDTLVLRFIDDFATAVRAFENNELDYTTADLTQLDQLIATYEPTGQYKKNVGASTRGLQMNQEHPPLDDKDVRMAIGKAIDWQTMITNCFSNGHEYTTTWLPEEVPGGQPTDWRADEYAFDVKAAQALVEGKDLTREFVMVVRVGTESECVGSFVQEQLRANLDMNVKVEVLEGPDRSARFREETFDLFPGGWVQDYPDPENWIVGLFDTDGGLNHYNCSNPQIDQLIADAQFNTNNEERISQYEEVNQLIVDEVCGIFVYYHEATHGLKAERVVGMFEHATSQTADPIGDWAAEAWGVTE
jgi:oligopeptide transport system substrate-binding protein